MKGLLFIVSMFWMLLPAGWAQPAGFQVSENQVTLQFPQAVKFHIAAGAGTKITRVTLIYGTEGASCQPGGARQSLEFTPATQVSLDWILELKRSGIFPPGTELWWQWELQDENGANLTTDRQHLVVIDPRHTWNKLEQHGVILQWYQGDQAFGQSLMDSIGKQLDRLSADLGLKVSNPIWITIYPNVDELKEVLLHTYEWVGAVAFPSYNSILLPAAPGQSGAWEVDTLAHEMTHLLVEEWIFNCAGIGLPTWLSEGLAMNGEGPIANNDRLKVTTALNGGVLPPLRSLERGFSGDPNEARLSYAQSSVVVDYLIQKKGGAKKLGDLLSAMQSGYLVDEALRNVYGVDTAGLDAEWRTSLGYTTVAATATAPAKAATAIPTFALYTSVARTTATPGAVPTQAPATASPSPAPSSTPLPSATPAPTLTTLPTPKPAPALPFCPSSLVFPGAILAIWFLKFRKEQA